MGIKCQMLTTRYVAKVREQLLTPDYKSRRFLRHFASRAILYDFFLASGQDRARRFMGAVAFIRGHETDAVITMPAFIPKLVCTPYHFDIKRNRQGYWIARDRGGLAGGTFLTRKDAEHFALFETGGDNAHVHTYPEAKAARIDGARAHRRS